MAAEADAVADAVRDIVPVVVEDKVKAGEFEKNELKEEVPSEEDVSESRAVVEDEIVLPDEKLELPDKL